MWCNCRFSESGTSVFANITHRNVHLFYICYDTAVLDWSTGSMSPSTLNELMVKLNSPQEISFFCQGIQSSMKYKLTSMVQYSISSHFFKQSNWPYLRNLLSLMHYSSWKLDINRIVKQESIIHVGGSDNYKHGHNWVTSIYFQQFCQNVFYWLLWTYNG